MTDYTELIRSLRNCSNNRCTPCDCGWFNKYQVDESCKEIIMWKAAAAIEALQAQLPKRGEWIWKHRHHGGFKTAKGKCECGRDVYAQIDERYETEDPYCPFCGVMNDSIHLNYCPNCGAKMEVQE